MQKEMADKKASLRKRLAASGGLNLDLEWRARAHEDRSKIFDYIAEDDPRPRSSWTTR
ncbi:protein of unknown function (plasmid) [Caballeronia sp. S22]